MFLCIDFALTHGYAARASFVIGRRSRVICACEFEHINSLETWSVDLFQDGEYELERLTAVSLGNSRSCHEASKTQI